VHASKGRWEKGFLLSKEVKGEFIDVRKAVFRILIHRLCEEFTPRKHIRQASGGTRDGRILLTCQG